MATITQDWGTVAEHTLLSTELDSLADDAYTSSETAVDLGDPGPFSLAAEAKLTGGASSTELVELYALWSADNTDFSDQSDNARNGELVAVVDMNGSTETKKVFQIQVRARYLILRAKNASGAALAANAGDIVATEASVNST